MILCVFLFSVVYLRFFHIYFNLAITVLGIFKFHPRSRLLCLSRSHHQLNPDL